MQVKGVPRAPSVPVAAEVAAFFEVHDDGLHRAFGEVAGRAEVAQGAAGSRAMASSTTLPAIGATDPGRIGQHGLESVMAVCRTCCVHREPVGKRIAAAIEPADDQGGDPAGSPPDPAPVP